MFTIIRRHATRYEIRASALGRGGILLATFRNAENASAFVTAMRVVTAPQLVR